jgi:hypothetical protein
MVGGRIPTDTMADVPAKTRAKIWRRNGGKQFGEWREGNGEANSFVYVLVPERGKCPFMYRHWMGTHSCMGLFLSSYLWTVPNCGVPKHRKCQFMYRHPYLATIHKQAPFFYPFMKSI